MEMHRNVKNVEGGAVAPCADCRPIGLRNSSLKVVEKAMAKKVMHKASLCCSEAQKGFIRGRDFIEHILELDSQGRCDSLIQFKRRDHGGFAVPMFGGAE